MIKGKSRIRQKKINSKFNHQFFFLRRYLDLEHQSEERKSILYGHLDDLQKRGPPPPPTATKKA